MEQRLKVSIYGDSIMKATVPDNGRYRFTVKGYTERLAKMFPVEITDRAHFGAVISKGEKLLMGDLEKGKTADRALIEFGGNDCDFDWKAVSDAPEEEHLPHTPLPEFTARLERMTDALIARGIKPVLMTLPPIDADRYLEWITKRDGAVKENLLKWLGDANMIYRFQELYSASIAAFAGARGIKLVDVRSAFLDKHNYRVLISEDGIHPGAEGYELIYNAFRDSLAGTCG